MLQTYGSNAWRIHNYRLEEAAKQAERALEELKERTTELNRERKNSQVVSRLLTILSTADLLADPIRHAVDCAGNKMDGVVIQYSTD